METETSPQRIAGLNITCDRCPATAAYRSETVHRDGSADVHWTCRAHTEN